MGSATDPWRVAQARHRNRADERGQVYGQEARTTVARLEDFPSQSCGWDRCDRSVRRADNLVSSAYGLPKIRQPREPEPSTINEKTIADFTRVVEQTGILERDVNAAVNRGGLTLAFDR